MGFWSDIKDWTNRQFNPTDPANNAYSSIDANNYNLPGYQQRADYSMGQAQGAQGRGAFTAADSPFRAYQQQALDNYQRTMTDPGNSWAMQQGQLDQAANAAQQRSLMASASPSNLAMMARVGSQNTARGNQAIAGNAMMGHIAERNNALNSMAGVAGAARGQDLGLNTFNAQQQAQNRAANDAYEQGMLGMNMQNAAYQQNGTMGLEANRAGRFATVAGQPTAMGRIVGGLAGGIQSFGSSQGGQGGGGGGGGGDGSGALLAAALSDKKAKTNIAPGKHEADSFMDNIDAITFGYKPGLNASQGEPRLPTAQPTFQGSPYQGGDYSTMMGRTDAERAAVAPVLNRNRAPEGPAMPQEGPQAPHLGVLAQDVQRSPMGQTMVQPGQGGLKTLANVTGPVLASLARLNERLKSVEEKKGVIKPPSTWNPNPPKEKAPMSRMLPGEMAK